MQNNSSRFATVEEIINDRNITKVELNDIKVSGLPIGCDGNDYYMDTNEMHNLVIGSTGSGKTQSIVIPMIKSSIMAGETFVTIDVKGELYNLVSKSLEEKNYNTVVIDFSDKQIGNRWNPFTLIINYYNNNDKRKANTLLRQMARQIFTDNVSASIDPFWSNSAEDYFIGLANVLLELKKDNITLLDIYHLSEYTGSNKYFFSKYFINKNNNSEVFLSSIINAPAETKGSIISVFKEKLNKFIVDSSLMNLMQTTDFDLINSDFKKTAVFIILPEYESFKEIYSILIRQLYDKLVLEIDNKRLNGRVNFIMDDFYKCSPIENLDLILSASRSRNIRFTVLLQAIEELTEMYGEEIGNKIKYQFGNTLYLLSNSIKTLEEISNICGKNYESGHNLITVEELRTLKQWEGILIKIRQYPFKTYLKPDYNLKWNMTNGCSNTTKREEIQISNYQLFKEFIESKVESSNVSNIDDLIKRIDDKLEELEKE